MLPNRTKFCERFNIINQSINGNSGFTQVKFIQLQICRVTVKNIIKDIGRYLIKFSFNSIIFILSIITTNKKRTAIAPTYTIIKIRPKNSDPIEIKSAAAPQKVKIRYTIECTGFFEKITKRLQEIINKDNKLYKIFIFVNKIKNKSKGVN